MFPLCNWIEQFCALVANRRNVRPLKHLSGWHSVFPIEREDFVCSICISIYVAAYLQKISSPATQNVIEMSFEFPARLVRESQCPKKVIVSLASIELILCTLLCSNIMIPLCYNLTPAANFSPKCITQGQSLFSPGAKCQLPTSNWSPDLPVKPFSS